MSQKTQIERLLEIMAQLRNPDGGCPWDLEQSFKTIAPYTVEEAYEVAEAVEKNDMEMLKDELGDLLLQVVFHAQMAAEEKLFDFEDVARTISDKMIRRHPHIFSDTDADTADKVLKNWEDIKAEERKEKKEDDSVLDGVALSLPALMRAEKLQKRAARVGFEWEDISGVYDKLEEEIAELRSAETPEDLEDEIGDMLFVTANLARWHKIDPEAALRRTNAKFEKRFRYIEEQLQKRGKTPADSNLQEMDALWDEAKAHFKSDVA
ncbi:MAG: nucleoside triphosphate pyrophosphohydrolase [Micavibrio sp.]|nr:MAG: nucleoside triphosphate pyrophosphohydrolase [Micavibrio sp.]